MFHSRALAQLTCGVVLVAIAQAHFVDVDPDQLGSFSYVIAGGGTAGLALAARLSEEPDISVLVLEAGDPHLDDPLILIPAQVGAVTGNPEYDWLYKTTPQPRADGNVFDFTRGKILGGCSALNAMIWDRSSKPEYNFISALGNPGWDWDKLLPYLKKSENFSSPDPEFARMWNLTFESSARGLAGPIKTAFTSYIPQAETPIEAAALELGEKIVSEPMGGRSMGTWRAESSVDPLTRTRSYSTTGYLSPNKWRPNLSVITGAQVFRIDWKNHHERGKMTARGVSFTMGGKDYTVNATLEVLLAAGTIGSPQILELSGIGGESRLKALGIEPVVDLPGVGDNLQDHIYITLSYRLQPGTGTLDPLFFNLSFIAEQEQLFSATPATGALTYTASGITMLGLSHFLPSPSKTLASLKSELAKVTRSKGQFLQQKIQFDWLHNPESSIIEILSEGVHITPDIADPAAGYASFLVLLQQPFSRGSTHIASKDVLDHPTIDPRYFEVDFDLKVLSTAAQFVRKRLTTTPAWASVIVNESFPGPSVETDRDWESWIKSTLRSQSHTTGTCSMQPRDVGGVVDPTLTVYGTSNVRVVDLSVMPLQFSGHPQALVYAIAEKAADIIKAAIHAS